MEGGRGYKTLPQEICGIICTDPCLDRGDLHSLSLVSRSFNAEAERTLYINVRIQGIQHVRSLCRTMMRRPFLANRVKKLELHMPTQLELLPDDLTKLIRTLKLTSKLEDLQFLVDEASTNIKIATGAAPCSPYTWILDGLTFPLKSFKNTYFMHTQEMQRFIQRHSSSLENLSLDGNKYDCGLSRLDTLDLPHLQSLCGPAVVMDKLAKSAFTQRLLRMEIKISNCTRLEDETNQMSLLVHYRDNLQSLSIQRWHCYDSPFGIEAILDGITLVAPDLKYLQIFNYGDYNTTGISRFSIWNPVNSDNLETLALRFRRLSFPHMIDDMEKGYARLSTPSGRLEAVQHISSSLLGLKRFVLIEDEAEVYTRNEEGIFELDPSAPPWDDKEWERVGMDLDEA